MPLTRQPGNGPKKNTMEKLLYNTSQNNYYTSQDIPREKNLNGFTFTNLGDTIAEVNGIVIFPSTTPATVAGDSVSIGGNAGEIYVGNIKLLFRTPVGAAPNVLIVQKFYLKDYSKENGQ